MFQVLPVRKGRARDDRIARTMIFRFIEFDVLLRCLLIFYEYFIFFFQTCLVDELINIKTKFFVLNFGTLHAYSL